MLKNLSDIELTERIKSLAADERKITRQVIEHIAELERRKIYLRQYSSLFEYLTKEIGYTNGSAQRRIDAARLLLNVPEVAEHIESGILNLSQISKLQMTCREVSKKTGQKVSLAQKKQALDKIKNLREVATDLLLAQEFQTEIKNNSKLRLQRDESVRVELTFSKEEIELIREAQALLSNKTGGGLKETLLELAKKEIKRGVSKISNRKYNDTKTYNSPNPGRLGNSDNPGNLGSADNTGRLGNSHNTDKLDDSDNAKQATTVVVKSVTPKLRSDIRRTHPVCEFRDPTSSEICGAKFYLEVDHIQPRSKGGDNSIHNLRMLCKNHNIYRYERNL